MSKRYWRGDNEREKEGQGGMYQPEKPVFRIVSSPSEAEEHLRVIRQAMERSTRHSTLSGLSGIVVGVLALLGCIATVWIDKLNPKTDHPYPLHPSPQWQIVFVANWLAVFLLAVLTDVVLTKRRAAQVGKTAFSPLGKHLTRAAAPGFLAGCAFCLFYITHPNYLENYLYGAWMLCYAASLLSVGMFSVREVSILGWAFLAAGFATLLTPAGLTPGPRMMAGITFGGFHVLYGAWMGYRYGW